jgi:hypothetical protein
MFLNPFFVDENNWRKSQLSELLKILDSTTSQLPGTDKKFEANIFLPVLKFLAKFRKKPLKLKPLSK